MSQTILKTWAAKTWNIQPNYKEVEKAYEDYEVIFGSGPWKAGKTLKKSIKSSKSRYANTNKFNILTFDSIFWEGEDEQLALEIEKTLQKILRDMGKCCNSDRDIGSSGGLSGKTEVFVVYLTTKKSKEHQCPVCERYFVTGKFLHYQEQHRQFVTYIQDDIANLENHKDAKMPKVVTMIKELRELISWFTDGMNCSELNSEAGPSASSNMQSTESTDSNDSMDSTDFIDSMDSTDSEDDIIVPIKKKRRIISDSDSD